MECLKCGRETDQTFCPKCREVMEKYPVKPGTAVNLPKRKSESIKKIRRHQITPEMQVEHLKKRIVRLWYVIVTLVLLLAIACSAAYYLHGRNKLPLPGQNYSTVTEPTQEQANKEN